MTGAGEHEPQLGPLARGPRRTPRTAARGSCAARRSRGRAGTARARRPSGREALVVDGEVDRAHALGIEVEPLDQRLPGVLGDRDHDRGSCGPSSRRRAAGRRARRARRTRGRPRAGRRARSSQRAACPAGGNITREREVDRVELVGAERAGGAGPARPPRAPSPPCGRAIERDARYSGTTVVGSPSPASAAIVGTKARYSSRPTRAERLAELARVGLGAADDPGHERQQRDPDHGPS